MTDINLTQSDADGLIKMPKNKADDAVYYFPFGGEKTEVLLLSEDKRVKFFLDLYRGQINLSKISYQNRGQTSVVLVRLDIGGAPHRNPDGRQVLCPHIHIYREGYGDKYAYDVSQNEFPNLDDYRKTLEDFMQRCNITKPPNIQKRLLS